MEDEEEDEDTVLCTGMGTNSIPIYEAVNSGNVEAVERLIKTPDGKLAAAGLYSFDHYSLLWNAIRANGDSTIKIKIMTILIEKGGMSPDTAHLEVMNGGISINTPLNDMILQQLDKTDLTIASFLLRNGANPNFHDGVDCMIATVLIDWAVNGSDNTESLYKLLVRSGAECDGCFCKHNGCYFLPFSVFDDPHRIIKRKARRYHMAMQRMYAFMYGQWFNNDINKLIFEWLVESEPLESVKLDNVRMFHSTMPLELGDDNSDSCGPDEESESVGW